MLGYCDKSNYIFHNSSHLDCHLVELLGRYTVQPRLHFYEDNSSSHPLVSWIINIGAESTGGLLVIEATTSFHSCADLNVIEKAVLRKKGALLLLG